MVQEFYGVIYLITCKVNGKQYVGQTTAKNPLKYIQGHFKSAKRGNEKLLYAAIRKHGAENFNFEIIWHCPDKVSLDISEDSFINFFDTIAPNGYNLKGGGSRGKHSDISRGNIRASLNGMNQRWINNGQKNRKLKKDQLLPDGWSYGRFGYVCDTSIEASERRSVAAKLVSRRPHIKAARVKASNARWAKLGAHEHASEIIRVALARPEAKEKRAATEADPEFKASRRETTIAQMADPIFLAEHTARMTAVMNDPIVAARHKAAYEKPETKKKLSAIASGTQWINDGVDNRKIQRNEPLPSGWSYGILTDRTKRSRSQAIGRHNRWHVRRGIKSPDCPLCNTQDEEP